MAIVRMEFMPKPITLAFGKFSETMTIGFLPVEFRNKMGLTMSPGQERFFKVHNAIVRKVVKILPGPLKHFPFNVLLADVRWRTKTGRSLV